MSCTTTEIKQVSKEGLQFIANEEGLILHPYRDSAGIPTIGYGNTYWENGIRVKMSDPPITKARALQLFKTSIVTYEKAVWSNTIDSINQNQFDALTSLCYNIGVNAFKGSTLLRRVNADPSDPTIIQAFEMWRYAAGRPILLARRQREAKLYFS